MDTKENTNLTLSISPDEDVASPREDDNLGTFAFWHKRYAYGDVQPKVQPNEYRAALPKDELVLDVYMIDHSGIAFSLNDFGDPWDSGQVGFYHVSSKRLVEEYGEDTPEVREKAKQLIATEIEVYNAYVAGNAWQYEVVDEHGETVESCGGYLGSNFLENGLAHSLPDSVLPQLPEVAREHGVIISDHQMKEFIASKNVSKASSRFSP